MLKTSERFVSKFSKEIRDVVLSHEDDAGIIVDAMRLFPNFNWGGVELEASDRLNMYLQRPKGFSLGVKVVLEKYVKVGSDRLVLFSCSAYLNETGKSGYRFSVYDDTSTARFSFLNKGNLKSDYGAQDGVETYLNPDVELTYEEALKASSEFLETRLSYYQTMFDKEFSKS